MAPLPNDDSIASVRDIWVTEYEHWTKIADRCCTLFKKQGRNGDISRKTPEKPWPALAK